MRGIRSGHCIVLLAALIAVAASKATADDILPCRRFTAENLPQPYPRGDRRGIERLKQINQTVKENPRLVLFLGDSLTEGWAPAIWERCLAPRHTLNAGVSGDYTENVLWRLENGNLAVAPQAVVLLIGTNDLAAGRSPELTADGIRANLDLLRRRVPNATILLLGLLPREARPDARLRRAVTQVNSLVRYCADGEHIIFAEIGDALLDSEGRLDTALSPHQLHFTERGYALLTSRFVPLLDRVLAGSQ
jgi:lysophospholipase L1-like esterase